MAPIDPAAQGPRSEVVNQAAIQVAPPRGYYRGLGGRLFPDHEKCLDAVRTLLMMVGEDPDREGLKETPDRVVKAMKEYCSGYSLERDVADLFKTFEDGSEKYDQMVCESGIPFYSHCEHHLAPFFGEASIAYLPNGRVVGLSKLPRLLEVYANRLQVQERLTTQVAQALLEHLQPLGVGVILKARHFCMECRGVRKPNVLTTTSALLGNFRDDGVKAEFFALAGVGGR